MGGGGGVPDRSVHTHTRCVLCARGSEPGGNFSAGGRERRNLHQSLCVCACGTLCVHIHAGAQAHQMLL
jgi:hypothetical protein